MGQLLMSFVDSMKAVDEKTFEMQLKEPYGLVAAVTGQAELERAVHHAQADRRDAGQQADLGICRLRAIRVRARPVGARQQGRVHQVQGLYAARRAAVLDGRRQDRQGRPVEWIWIPDHQTAVNALVNGEIDIIEAPPHDLLPVIEADGSIVLFDSNPLGNQYMFRINWLHPPFDDQKIRQAAIAALNQEDFLRAVVGDPRYYKVCPAMFICGTPFATDEGADLLVESTSTSPRSCSRKRAMTARRSS